MEIVTSNNDRFWTYWAEITKTVDFQHPAYSEVGLKFYKEYFFSDKAILDQSFIVINENVPLIGVILSITHDDSQVKLSGFGRGINYMENNEPHCVGMKSARKFFKKQFNSLIDEHKVNSIFFRDYTSTLGNLSILARHLLDMGAEAQIIFMQLIDLNNSLEDIHSDLAKSCRHGINWGRKNIEISHFDSSTITMEQVENLRQMHIQEAGRETRTKKSWEIMYDMIINNVAFIIEGRIEGSLVTSSLFYLNSRVCLYAVSASSRSLFDKPLGHIILWEAITQAKSLGCNYFDLGDLSYSSPNNTVSKKEMNINRYKKNFGGETKIQLSLDWNAK